MNYQIVKDTEELAKFVDWLPELNPGETYYVSLLARSKYASGVKHINSDRQQLKRFLSTKEFLYEKIRQLECEVGRYTQKHNPMPQEALALYITPNPRSLIGGAKNGLVKLAQLITKEYNGYNPVQELMSAVHKSCSRKIFLDIDFDNPYREIGLEDAPYYSREYFLEVNKEAIEDIINKDCLTYLETRGGFHVLIELSKIDTVYTKTWYNRITSLPFADISDTNLIPIPGCTQGNFIPRML